MQQQQLQQQLQQQQLQQQQLQQQRPASAGNQTSVMSPQQVIGIPPNSSPGHHSTPQSPITMMSPSPSPLQQQTLPQLHSPSNPSGMSPLGMQPSPRIGTPHSQVFY